MISEFSFPIKKDDLEITCNAHYSNSDECYLVSSPQLQDLGQFTFGHDFGGTVNAAMSYIEEHDIFTKYKGVIEDVREVFSTYNGEEYCSEELAIADLLNADVLFCNCRDYVSPFSKELKVDGRTVVLFVLCSDVFAWGCADGEDITTTEIPELYRLWKSKGCWGVIKWLCRKRNQKPQFPVARDMKAAGHWDEEMEALPENVFDSHCAKVRESKDNEKSSTS